MHVSFPFLELLQSGRRPNDQAAIGGLLEPGPLALRRLSLLNLIMMLPKRAEKIFRRSYLLKLFCQLIETGANWAFTQRASRARNILRQFSDDFGQTWFGSNVLRSN